MIRPLVTGDGIPITHHAFTGNASDVTTLPEIMEDLQRRFGVGHVALVVNRVLISENNIEDVEAHVTLTPKRALAELANARLQFLGAGAHTIELASRPKPACMKVLSAFDVPSQGGARPSA